jgi:hypothetical protein
LPSHFLEGHSADSSQEGDHLCLLAHLRKVKRSHRDLLGAEIDWNLEFLYQPLENLYSAFISSYSQAVLVFVSSDAHVCTAVDQQLSSLEESVLASHHESSEAFTILQVNFSALLNQVLACLSMPLRSSFNQCRTAVLMLMMDSLLHFSHEPLHNFKVATESR